MNRTETGHVQSSSVVDAVLQTFLREVAPVRDRILSFTLFGSRARGSARPDSDYDVLVLTHKRDATVRDALYEGVMRALLDHGRLVSLKIFSADEFERLVQLNTPFTTRVRAEGIGIG